jgi:hypothetical protein
MKPVQDLSNEELLAEIDTYKPEKAEKGSRRFELGRGLARRIKDKTIKFT